MRQASGGAACRVHHLTAVCGAGSGNRHKHARRPAALQCSPQHRQVRAWSDPRADRGRTRAAKRRGARIGRSEAAIDRVALLLGRRTRPVPSGLPADRPQAHVGGGAEEALFRSLTRGRDRAPWHDRASQPASPAGRFDQLRPGNKGKVSASRAPHSATPANLTSGYWG
jgi:hypothetical protein